MVGSTIKLALWQSSSRGGKKTKEDKGGKGGLQNLEGLPFINRCSIVRNLDRRGRDMIRKISRY